MSKNRSRKIRVEAIELLPGFLFHDPRRHCSIGGFPHARCPDPIEYISLSEIKSTGVKLTYFLCREHAIRFAKRHNLAFPGNSASVIHS